MSAAPKDDGSFSERVSSSYRQLSLAASHLNIVSDELGKSISVLDAALRAGADLPYACKAGVCCTCRAMLVEGEVRMDANYTLSDEELQQGFRLTCQSHPVTPRVVLDYDRR